MGVSNHSSIQINKPREAIVQLACTMILAAVYPGTPQLGMVYLGYTTLVVQPVVLVV